MPPRVPTEPRTGIQERPDHHGGLFQLVLAARLVLLRRIITPVVSGTLLALISVTVMPMGFALLTEVPAQAPTAAAPTITLVTAAAALGLMLRAPRLLRAWTPVLANLC